MAATCGFTPAKSAISSMHRIVISVESMSIARSRKSWSGRNFRSWVTSRSQGAGVPPQTFRIRHPKQVQDARSGG